MTLFYGQRLTLEQPFEDDHEGHNKGYRPSIDAIFLAAAISQGNSVLDVGCGIGTVGFCLKIRRPEIQLTGIDIQQDNIVCAQKNALKNHIEATFVQGDIKTFTFPTTFDHVISNPPFYEAHKVNLPKNRYKLLSHVLSNITLKEWVDFCIQHSHNYVTFIHLPEKLPELLALLNPLGAIKVFPLWTQGKAERIIIQACKKSKADLKLLSGLTLQNKKGYTEEAEDILKHAKGMNL